MLGEIINRIRDVIKKAPPGRDRLDINEAIREVIELTRAEAAKNSLSVHAELASSLPPVRGDRVELRQVVLNLVVNALEAMDKTPAGIADQPCSRKVGRIGEHARFRSRAASFRS